MTPKSLLGNTEATSSLDDFLEGNCFQEVLPDPQEFPGAGAVQRVIFCTGKVFYDLLAYRREHQITNTAIIRIEQLYPFHHEMVRALAGQYPGAAHFVWCQEEPANMGAWSFIRSHLETVIDTRIGYAGRDAASSTAAGSKAVHYREQKELISTAFRL